MLGRSLCRINRASSLLVGRTNVVLGSQFCTAKPTENHSVYIGNIPFSVSSTDLADAVTERVSRDLFRGVKIIFDREKGRSKGFGYVDFNDAEGAIAGCASLQGLKIEGRESVVDMGVPNKGQVATNSVFIGNLDAEVSEEGLIELITTILGCEADVVKRVRLGKANSAGLIFAHADLDTAENKQSLLEKMSGYDYKGNALKIDSAMRKPPYTKTVFVGNLSWDVTTNHMTEMLNEVIGVDRWYNLRIAVDKATGNPRGFAFCDFSSLRSASAAITELNGIEMFGRQLRAQISDPKTAKKPPASHENTETDMMNHN